MIKYFHLSRHINVYIRTGELSTMFFNFKELNRYIMYLHLISEISAIVNDLAYVHDNSINVFKVRKFEILPGKFERFEKELLFLFYFN